MKILCLLIKGVSETILNGEKEPKAGFFSMLLSKLGATLLAKLSTGKRVKAKIPRREVIRAGVGTIATSRARGTIRAGQGFYCCLIL